MGIERRIDQQLRELERKRARLPSGLFDKLGKPILDDQKVPAGFYTKDGRLDYTVLGLNTKTRTRIETETETQTETDKAEAETNREIDREIDRELDRELDREKILQTLKTVEKQLSNIQGELDSIKETICKERSSEREKGRFYRRKIIRVAKQFCKLLKKRIGANNLAEVVEANRHYGITGPCASHEFCDANIIMENALRSFNLRVGFYDEDVIWNEAWIRAKKADFDPNKIR
jgi:hypothetical protein